MWIQPLLTYGNKLFVDAKAIPSLPESMNAKIEKAGQVATVKVFKNRWGHFRKLGFQDRFEREVGEHRIARAFDNTDVPHFPPATDRKLHSDPHIESHEVLIG